MRPVQYFTKEYLAQCARMKPEQIVRFLEDFRRLQAGGRPPKSKLISVKVPEPLLQAFRAKAGLAGVPYQTQIKRLMSGWVEK